MKRRNFLSILGVVSASLAGMIGFVSLTRTKKRSPNPMILKQFPLDFQWPTQEPFLFCVHHLDHYPKGDPDFAPDRSLLGGREIGQDFKIKDGFRMYHGKTVPGFPVHPHRGFETVTLVRRGYVDHADSMGAAGRYGGGDAQWMTAGRGVQHSEMFPLLRPDEENTLELFQIWLNLPKARKMAEPDFKMLWSEKIPVVEFPERKARVTLVAGAMEGHAPPPPPKASWAHDPGNETLIWIVRLEQGGEFEIPGSRQSVARSLYFFDGTSVLLGDMRLPASTGAFLDSREKLVLRADGGAVELLLLQSKAIGEPVVQHGPFVMNSKEEIRQTFEDYRSTEFGGWPWERPDPVHGSKIERFAKYPDGRVDRPAT